MRGKLFLIGVMICSRLALPIAASAAGAAATTQTSTDFTRSWLLHLPGIAGEMHMDRELIAGLKAGGWEGPLKIYDWTEHDPGIDALRNRKRNEAEAAKVAKLIEKRLTEDPRAQITVTSHSGGTGIAVWALEDLPENVQVRTLVLLASALSPQYDLSRALRHVSGHAYLFYSQGDAVVLGTGTRLFGTIDGVRTDAAGLIGFRVPEDADREQYAKLVQRPYEKGWMIYGHIGNHIGSLSQPFAENVLAALLIADLKGDPAATRPIAR